MQARTRMIFTAAEYRALDDASDDKNEYIDGRILARAGGSPAHNMIVVNIGAELRAGLRRCGGGCRVYSSDQRVQIATSGNCVYPDVTVACPPVHFDGQTLLNPRVIVEVLSPTTADYDRGQKLARYLTLPSVTDVLLVEQHTRRVEHHRRVDSGASSCQVLTAGALEIESLGVVIPIDEIYHLVELPG